MSRVLIILLLVSLAVFGVSVFSNQNKISEPRKTVVVTSSIYPLYEFAREIGGTYITSTLITPSGVEPHEYEPTPQDILTISNSSLFLYISSHLETWAKKATQSLPAYKPVVLETSSVAPLDENDPHIWIDPVIAIDIVTAIKNSLIALDPKHSEEYETNTNEYIEKLNLLDAEYRLLSSCSENTIVTTHNAFHYVAKRYGFTVYPISGLSPEDEPSAQKLSEITTLVKQKHIGYIFYETLVSNAIAETIARETGTKVAKFNPIEGLTQEEMKQEKTYIDVQNENIKNLKLALVCQQ